MQSIKSIRREIDQIDSELLVLLKKRSAIIQTLLKAKIASDQKLSDEQRESEILQKIQHQNKSLYSSDDISEIYRAIFRASLNLQKQQQHRLQQNLED
ncbi:chorismate mutase [Kangiella spongicola]|uniref:chorismate mutase n=1 Tax=Kangiella spongicola TaxID=796379 RepID=A0A318D1B2_9GAMM|nr:chorismate mutase [Kangiella spongicola]PXF63012.1 chorismate mutase [Kangiella spongicola]